VQQGPWRVVVRKRVAECWAVHAAVGWSVAATWTIRRRSYARTMSTKSSR
jgi:hypothetical protein